MIIKKRETKLKRFGKFVVWLLTKAFFWIGVASVGLIVYFVIHANTGLIDFSHTFSQLELDFRADALTSFSKVNTPILREEAVRLTETCMGNDEYCFARRVYDELRTYKYLLSPSYNPEYTLETKHCDCDSCSILFSALMYQLTVHTKIECATGEGASHCWNVVTLRDDTNIIVDVAIGKFGSGDAEEYKEYIMRSI